MIARWLSMRMPPGRFIEVLPWDAIPRLILRRRIKGLLVTLCRKVPTIRRLLHPHYTN